MISRSRLKAAWVAVALLGLSPAVATAQTQEVDAPRLVLAERLLSLAQGPNITKQIELQLREIAVEAPGLTDEQRAWMMANTPRMITEMLGEVIEDLTLVYAENFTLAELQAQIDFNESAIGQSILQKSVAIGFEQAQIMEVHEGAFVTELMTKFCVRFDCGAISGAAKPD